MSDILVLMRHGKAERPKEGKLDMERKLTEAGKRALDAKLPHMLRLLPGGDAHVQVWTSPAARADQTAKLVQRACKRAGVNVDADVVTVESLWTQDAEPFLEEVRACKADVVFAVGHNPFIEELSARLSGSSIAFTTAGMAALKLAGDNAQADADTPPARLLWFVQGPEQMRWKTLVHMERVLGDAADTVNERLDSFYEDPQDPETMHKFRVSIRTLRSLLAFVAPWQESKQNKGAQKRLKAIVAETSRLRELDVLAQQAIDLEGASPQLAEYCLALAEQERERVLAALCAKRVVKDLDWVSKQLHTVKWRKDANREGIDARSVRARFDELADALSRKVERLDIADAEATHDVRKEAKRVRYDAEKFEELVGEDAIQIAKDMTAHQDNLGALCDARVNIDIINSLPTDGMSEQVAWDLALLRAQNETYLYTALREANQ